MSQYCVLCYAWGMCLYIPLKVNPPGIIWSWLPAVAFRPYAYLGSTILSTDRPIFFARVSLHADLRSRRWSDTYTPACEWEWGGTRSPTLALLVTRSFSSLGTALTANKGILHIWQNISRVTFWCSVYVLWKIKSWAHLPESFAKRGWSHLILMQLTPLCGRRRWKGDFSGRIRLLAAWWIPRVMDNVLPSCRELDEDGPGGHPAWLACCRRRTGPVDLL